MKNAVIIKSFQNGISVYLDEMLPFEELLNEIAFKFKESNHFFKNAKMAISLEGRHLSEEEERLVLDTISVNSDIHIVCLVGKNEETNQNYLKALQQLEYRNNNQEDEGHFYRGTLRNGQILETESSIVVLGDVYPGSSIISTKDIVILGGLFGKAYAGGNGNEGHFVVALEMSPEKLKIGDFKYKSNDKQIRWPIKSKVQPKIAYVKNNRVVMEPITKELLSDLTL
ncbi:MAG: septum site-determining protein MinC [Clostridiales bacterium]|nr:septum site-determining protein MinC [Clostridiales bacterium]